MSIKQRLLYTVTCDACGELLVNDECYAALFDTAADALETATEMLWRPDPGGRLDCPNCAGRGDCVAYGHDWAGWVEQLALIGRPVWTRTCRRCDTTETVDTDDLDTAEPDNFPNAVQEGHLS